MESASSMLYLNVKDEGVKNDEESEQLNNDFNDLQTTVTDGRTTEDRKPSTIKRYGFGPIALDCLQVFNKPVYFLVISCIVIFNFGFSATGLNNTMLTSIEKRYGFKSTQIALFTMTQHLVAGVVAIFVCYIGHKHRPVTIAIGCFISSIGFLTISIPQYVVPLYQAGVAMDTDFCRANSTITTNTKGCSGKSLDIDDNIDVLPIFLLGYALLGIGVTPLYSLGAAHIDHITTRKQSSVYFAVFALIGFIGPAIGFVAGNPILRVYVDINQPSQSNLKPTDRNWVGAWWISFVIGSIITFIPILPMLGFASEFPNTRRVIESNNKHVDTIRKDQDLKHDLGDFIPAFKKLLKNKPFMFLILSNAVEALTISGFSVFLPKYLETQFYLTASSAASYVGFAILPGSVFGILIGGYLCRRFSFNGRKLLIFNLIALCASTIFFFGLVMGCDSRDIVGATSAYYNSSSTELSIDNKCNRDCQCSMKFYKPVCSVLDQRTFYSPCHAGCSTDDFRDGLYTNCTCIPLTVESKMVDGRCMPECSQLTYFMILIFFNLFFTFVTNVPKAQAYFRLVPEGQGSLGQGLQQTIARFLGFIPAGPFFGSLIDRSCELWHIDECTGETTSCLEYDNHKFKYYLMALAFLTKIISIILMVLSIKFYRLPKKQERSGGDDEANEQVELM